MTRYLPSKQFQYAGVTALVLAAFCGIFAWNWPVVWILTGLFLAVGGMMLAFGLMPPIEVHETHLAIGDRLMAWDEIRSLDRTGFISPLIMRVVLANNHRFLLVYPGGIESSNALLRHLRRMSREATIDGIPYRQFWGEGLPSSTDRRALPSP